jgi:hypothetical protein
LITFSIVAFEDIKLDVVISNTDNSSAFKLETFIDEDEILFEIRLIVLAILVSILTVDKFVVVIEVEIISVEFKLLEVMPPITIFVPLKEPQDKLVRLRLVKFRFSNVELVE